MPFLTWLLAATVELNELRLVAAGTDHELADAASGIRDSGGGLSREALVVVAVTTQDHVGARGVERRPEVAHV